MDEGLPNYNAKYLLQVNNKIREESLYFLSQPLVARNDDWTILLGVGTKEEGWFVVLLSLDGHDALI